jgi:hypothetical protein
MTRGRVVVIVVIVVVVGVVCVCVCEGIVVRAFCVCMR